MFLRLQAGMLGREASDSLFDRRTITSKIDAR